MFEDRFNRRRLARLAVGLLGAVALGPLAVLAQNANQGAKAIIRSLAPKAKHGAAPNVLPPVMSDQRPVTADGDTGPVDVVIDPSVSWDATLDFDHDSAVIAAKTKAQLAALDRALVAPELAGHSSLVAGQTDAIGSAAYNRDLSLRRAAWVRRSLIRAVDVDPKRLLVVGFGFDRLKVPQQPMPVARRVEFSLNIGPSAP